MNTTTAIKSNPVLTLKGLEESLIKINFEKFVDKIYIPKEIKNKFKDRIVKNKKKRFISSLGIKVTILDLLPENVMMLEYNDKSSELLIFKEDGLYKMDLDKVREQLHEMFMKNRFTIDY